MIVLGIILGILILILLLPVGAWVRYDGEATVKLVAGPVKLQLVPAKPKSRKKLKKEQEKKEQKAKKKAEDKKKAQAAQLIHKDPAPPKPPKPKEPLLDKIDSLLPFAKLAVDALGSVFRRLTVKKLIVHVRYGGSDPVKVADNYGKIMATLWGASSILMRKFKIKKSDVQITPDFTSGKTEVEAELYIRYLIFDLLGIAFKYGFRGLKLLIRYKKHEKELLKQQEQELLETSDEPKENNLKEAV